MVRTRFAPSPTGFLHIGSLRTAVYAYALARHSGGEFLLRIEDTDQKREVAGAAKALQTTLSEYGLTWDALHIQSARVPSGIYSAAAQKLLDSGHAFYCQCEAKNAKKDGFSKVLRDPCRDRGLTSGAIKLKVPDNREIAFTDYVHGKPVTWNTDTVADATLLKSDGFPTYHLAVVVDDTDMGITHVLRGHDWFPSTPVHLLVYEFLGLTPPQIGHLTDILDPAGGKLSKRKGSTTCEGLKAAGYLPEAVLNFVLLLGWAPKDNREMFSLAEFVSAFNPDGFQTSNPVFNAAKLDWFNGQYLRQLPDTELTQRVKPFVKSDYLSTHLEQVLPLFKDRLQTLADLDNLALFLVQRPTPQPDLIADPAAAKLHLDFAERRFATSDWSKTGIEEGLVDAIKAQGWKVGDFFMTLRVAICASKFTPPLTDVMLVLGQAESLARLAELQAQLPA